MVERKREGGRCDYCLVGSQKNRSAQKYVVRERGTVSDIINTLETYSESARPRARSHVLANTHTHMHSCNHSPSLTHTRCLCANREQMCINSYKQSAAEITSTQCYDSFTLERPLQ